MKGLHIVLTIMVVMNFLACHKDTDGDGVDDIEDNCHFHPNSEQGDLDRDGVGDICDYDMDNDRRQNDFDNCPRVYNYDQNDFDDDGEGDACDEDCGEDCDNCPDLYNPDQLDTDDDGRGDACDDDMDNDDVPNDEDNCLRTSNPDQEDADSDGIGDACDNCQLISNPRQGDWDEDGLGNACSCPSRYVFADDYWLDMCDYDRDTVPDREDNCDRTPNYNQADSNGNGVGDACELDVDSDGVPNIVDNCPHIFNPLQLDDWNHFDYPPIDPRLDPRQLEDFDYANDGIGNACSYLDCDRDGVFDHNDNCPDIRNPDQLDTDVDGQGDVCDICPNGLGQYPCTIRHRYYK